MTFQSVDKLSEASKLLLSKIESKIDQLSPQERLNIPLQEMPTQDPKIRSTNMNEVALSQQRDLDFFARKFL